MSGISTSRLVYLLTLTGRTYAVRRTVTRTRHHTYFSLSSCWSSCHEGYAFLLCICNSPLTKGPLTTIWPSSSKVTICL
ncbi:hypothetical protein IW262DRAFT_331397 [Armillaria fumosa]|nr:hypothetical protein IW262DRAFT_331397 [Armillaria fumosa]